jgi:hypothetical protein
MVKAALRIFAMQLARPAFAMDPKRFGKGQVRELSGPAPAPTEISNDLKLFAITFAAGFLFVSILIG